MLMKFNMSDDYAEYYKTNGYVIIKDLFSTRELDRAKKEVALLFEARFFGLNKKELKGYDLLTIYFEEEKEMWMQCAKRVWDLLSVYSLASKPAVNNTLRKIGLKAPMISTRPELRIDMPKDEQFVQPWHQDWRYTQGGLKDVTIWVPLHAVCEENGAIYIISKTHLMGCLKTKEQASPRRFIIDDPHIKDLHHHPVELEFGDTILFSQMLVHRSGYNRSELPRMTVQLRFSDYSERSFVEYGFPYMTTSQSMDLVWDPPPSDKDMQRVFEE